MAFLGNCIIDQSLTFYANTHDVDTGVETAASAITYEVFEVATSMGAAAAMTLISDGFYYHTLTLSAANSFEIDKTYAIKIEATVDGVQGAMHHTFNMVATPVVATDIVSAGAITTSSGAVSTVTTTTTATNLTNLPAITTDWLTAAGTAADFTTEIQAGLSTAAELAKVPKSDGTASWNATALAAINAEADTALTDYDPPTNAEMEARTLVAASYFDPAADTVATVTTVSNQVSADVTAISGTTAAADKLEASMETLLLGTATGGTTSTVTSAATGHGDDTFIGRVLIFRDGTLQYEAGVITDYDSTAGTFTFATSTWTTSPTTETWVIV